MWEEVAMVVYENWNELPAQERNNVGRYKLGILYYFMIQYVKSSITLFYTDTKVLPFDLQNNL